MIAEQICQTLGLNTLTATNGQQAIDILKTHVNIDVVLMDIQMPILDGVEATKIIRSNTQWDNLPILAVTANAHRDDLVEYMSIGMQGALPKPFSIPDMKMQLASVLAKND